MPRARINKRLIDSLKPKPAGEVVIFDTQLPRFGVRVKATGMKTYFIQYRNLYGRTRRMALGRHGVVTPEQARRAAIDALGMLARGIDPQANKARARGATLQELGDRYLKEHVKAHNKASTARHVRSDLKNHILPAFGARKVNELTTEEISALHLKMQKTPNAANRMLRILSKMMTEAERWGLRKRGTNPCSGIPKFKEKKRQRFLSPSEIGTLGKALIDQVEAGRVTSAVADCIRLIALTGCRPSEIRLLKWIEVDLRVGCLSLEDSKTGPKVVQLGTRAREILASHPRTSSWVFPSSKNVERPYTELRFGWERIREAAGLDGLRLHDLRHTLASNAAEAGVSLQAIGKLLGHTQVSTTAGYAHLVDDPIRATAERVQGRIAAALEGNLEAPVIPIREGLR